MTKHPMSNDPPQEERKNDEIRMSKAPLMKRFLVVIPALIACAFVSADVLACSVCQGNPDADLTKGAQAGILLMVGVTYSVLLGFIGLVVFWFVRGRRAASL